MDKSQAMIKFLQTCPAIKDNQLFFNFGDVQNGAHQVMTHSDDTILNRAYIDGSEAKRYTFSVDSFESVAYNPIVENYSDENLEHFQTVQALLDWVNDNGDNQIFPDFGKDCLIEKMRTTTSEPEIVTVDTEVKPPIAIYRVSIQIDYIDFSKRLWN